MAAIEPEYSDIYSMMIKNPEYFKDKPIWLWVFPSEEPSKEANDLFDAAIDGLDNNKNKEILSFFENARINKRAPRDGDYVLSFEVGEDGHIYNGELCKLIGVNRRKTGVTSIQICKIESSFDGLRIGSGDRKIKELIRNKAWNDGGDHDCHLYEFAMSIK